MTAQFYNAQFWTGQFYGDTATVETTRPGSFYPLPKRKQSSPKQTQRQREEVLEKIIQDIVNPPQPVVDAKPVKPGKKVLVPEPVLVAVPEFNTQAVGHAGYVAELKTQLERHKAELIELALMEADDELLLLSL